MTFFLIIGGLQVFSLMVLWFLSPLKLTLGKILFKQNYNSPNQFDDKLFVKNNILGTISGCIICMSFWTSLSLGIVYAIIFQLPVYYPIITFLTYPGACYYLFSKIKP